MRRTPKQGIYVLLAVDGKRFWSPMRLSTERPLERDEDSKTWANVQLPAIAAPEDG